MLPVVGTANKILSFATAQLLEQLVEGNANHYR